MDFASFIKEFGLPIAILVALGWFLFKDLWPWSKIQIERLNTERKEEREQFLAALAAFRALAEQQHDANFDAMSNFTRQMDALSKAVTEIALVVKTLIPPTTPRKN